MFGTRFIALLLAASIAGQPLMAVVLQPGDCCAVTVQAETSSVSAPSCCCRSGDAAHETVQPTRERPSDDHDCHCPKSCCSAGKAPVAPPGRVVGVLPPSGASGRVLENDSFLPDPVRSRLQRPPRARVTA